MKEITRQQFIDSLSIPDNACLTTTRKYAGRYYVLYMPESERYVLLDPNTGLIKIPSQIAQANLQQKWVRHLMPTYGSKK